MSKLSKEWQRFMRRLCRWFGKAENAEADTLPKHEAPALKWCWGGLDGSKATETDKARIKNLRVSSSGLSYDWETGGCEALGATSREDASHTIACLFLEDGRGGKFDWISTSRRTRDFANIKGGYNGWSKSAFAASRRVWFCICSKDGRTRTNLICADK